MNVPLRWLSEYVLLPDSVSDLTDRLTMIGHMLDKKLEVQGEHVIDLELRGNRSDLFGLIGIARDISAAWDVPLQIPSGAKLPAPDKKSKLITVEAGDLVPRFTGLTVKVAVTPSPEWLIQRLSAYGMASINTVVDITNYVMIETGIPIHAFDKNKLSGGRLIVRRAKKHEHMVTFMGGKIVLTPEDIVLADETSPQAITLVGSKSSGTTEETTEILLEAAVYNQASVRRTSRRLGVRTEAGTRLEKHLDPNDVVFALSRAYKLLQELAHGEASSPLADVYPHPTTSRVVDLPFSETMRLSGIVVPQKQQKTILERLGCKVKEKTDTLVVEVPTFRTDISEAADLVEEITRIIGYETVPAHPLDGELPVEQTSERINQEEKIKHILVNLQLNEVITSTFIPNVSMTTYAIDGLYTPVLLTNPPDPALATLRPSLIPNLVDYAHRSLNERAERVALFESGKTYRVSNTKKKIEYQEERTLGIVIGGSIDTKSYGKNPRPLTFFDIKGIVETFSELNGVSLMVTPNTQNHHPSLDIQQQATLVLSDNPSKHVGVIGKLHPAIQQSLGLSTSVFVAELSLDTLLTAPKQNVKPYRIAPQYPPLIEDISLIVETGIYGGDILATIQTFDPIISEVKLLDVYQNKRTFRIVYHNPNKNLSGEEVRPIREKLITALSKKFSVKLSE